MTTLLPDRYGDDPERMTFRRQMENRVMTAALPGCSIIYAPEGRGAGIRGARR
jgi:hypothetical protein